MCWTMAPFHHLSGLAGKGGSILVSGPKAGVPHGNSNPIRYAPESAYREGDVGVVAQGRDISTGPGYNPAQARYPVVTTGLGDRELAAPVDVSPIDGDDGDNIRDPVDDAEVTAACAVKTLELTTHRFSDSARILSDRPVDELHSRERGLLWQPG